ncbi:hypothetical protein BBJ28_00007759 [Nothophytophthora sp. Chile5]|nr:hypothetical protein BBJ28_00007759 [Nothophytophthora sp. Chile5]
MLSSAPELVEAQLHRESTLKYAVSRCPPARAPSVIQLLVKHGADRPEIFDRIEEFACDKGVEPSVLDCLLESSRLLQRSTRPLDYLVLRATEAWPANVRLVAHLLDLWELEKAGDDPTDELSEQLVLDRLKVLLHAIWATGEGGYHDNPEAYLESVLKLPKICEAVHFAVASCRDDRVSATGADIQRATKLIIKKAWGKLATAMEALAPDLVREAAFVCVNQEWWQAVRAQHKGNDIEGLAELYLADSRWSIVGQLVMAHCCHRQLEHPLAMLPDLAFNRIVEYGRPSSATIADDLIKRRTASYCCEAEWLDGSCPRHGWWYSASPYGIDYW